MPSVTTNVLSVLQDDIRHIRKDVDLLKAMFLEDALLTVKERKHIDETMRLLKQRKKDDFVKLV